MQDLAIFISYRRADTSPDAGRLYDALRRRFGRDSLFMDVDSLRPGQDWVDAIEKAVSRCDVLLALIGSDFVDAVDEHGRRRLDNEFDPVRLEIEAAIRLEKPVIPVLFDHARMPTPEELPASLQPLLRRHAVRIAHASFEADLTPLVRSLRALARAKPSAETAAGGTAAAVAAGTGRRRTVARTRPKATESSAGRARSTPALAGAAVVAVAALIGVVVLGKFAVDAWNNVVAPGASPTPTMTSVQTASPGTAPPIASPPPSASAGVTATPTQSMPLATPTLTATPTEVPLATGTTRPSPTPSRTPKPTAKPTPTPTASPRPTPTPTPAPKAAKMSSPLPVDGPLSGASVVFDFGGAVGDVLWYSIYIGTSPGGSQIDFVQTDPCPSCPTTLATSKMPADGTTVYVRLYTKFRSSTPPYDGGPLLYRDYTYVSGP